MSAATGPDRHIALWTQHTALRVELGGAGETIVSRVFCPDCDWRSGWSPTSGETDRAAFAHVCAPVVRGAS